MNPIKQHIAHRLKEIVKSMELSNEFMHNVKYKLPSSDTLIVNVL